MNTFQENLQKAISEIIKVSEIIVSSDKASQLDIDILLEKLRKTYDVAISFEVEKQEILFHSPIIINKEEKEQEIEETFVEKIETEDAKEEQKEEKEEVIFEEVPEIIINEQVEEIEKEDEQDDNEEEIEQDEEAIINEKIEELIEEIKEEVKEIEKEIVEEKIELFEQRSASKQITIEHETLFDTDIFETQPIIQDPIFEVKPVETPSVLKYLNEQMPKKNEVGQMFEKKEIELIPNKQIAQPIVEEKIIEKQTQEIPLVEKPQIEKPEIEKPQVEKSVISNNQHSTTIGERYTQNKSVFDNISNSANKSDVSSRFKSNNFDLRTAIGVNEKFMFINDLFSGNLRGYTEFIQKLNEAESLESATQILNQTKEENRWIANSLPYTTLHEIMIKKFHY